MATISDLDALGSAKYISLTTYRKDGTAVSTPVWLVRDQDTVLVLTDPNSGKVKRLRNNPAARVSPCDMRGRVKADAPSVAVTVTLQDDAGTQRTMELIEKRYGLMGRIIGWMNERRARKAADGPISHQGLVLTLDGDGTPGART
jgi:PPOX class probable F420-dependent enzyme